MTPSLEMDLTIFQVCSYYINYFKLFATSFLYLSFFFFPLHLSHSSSSSLLSLSSEMMGVIYNFIRVDPDNFISNQRHIEIVISMAKTVSGWVFLVSN